MIGQTVTFDGHRLNDLFFVGDVDVGLPEFAPDVDERHGRGSVVRSTRMGSLELSVRLVAKPVQGARPRESVSKLLSWLDVDGPRPLTLSSDGGLVRMCVPRGAPTPEGEYYDDLTVTFLQPDPLLFGEERSVTVPSGGSASFVVGGDAPTWPKVAGQSVTRDSSTQLWGIRLDEGDFMRVKLPTSSAQSVLIDCDEDAGGVRVAGVTSMLTLDSDWWELSPGTHAVRNELGGGSCVVSWRERWHR